MASRKAAKKTTKATYKVEAFDGMTTKTIKRGMTAAEAKKLATSLQKKFAKYVYEACREHSAPTKAAKKTRKR